MEIDELTYDIDNVDIEEEMETKDIEDEEEQAVEEMEQKEAEVEEKTANDLCSKLSAKNLELDLGIKNENNRRKYKFSKDHIHYTGYVIHKMDKDTYLFNVKDSETNTEKIKKFKLSEIKLIK